ncbi:TIGR00268 family protein [Streptomyces sp. PRKS01-65]|nr:TIGR00268 family protein [Streptomyces harenosi]
MNHMPMPPTDPPASRAAQALLAEVGRLDSVVVAYSGGVGSTVVLAAALRALGRSDTLAAIADSPALARDELLLARRTAAELGAELVVLPTDELAVPGYRANTGDRCYFCKRTVLAAVAHLAAARGYAHVATGTHRDDHRSAHRPGLRAARERGAVEPLATAGLGKAQVRAVAREWGLAVADKPGTPCLASRIAVGVPVTRPRLQLVEHAETAVRGFLSEWRAPVRDLRVRLLAGAFRVEVDAAAHRWLAGRPERQAELLDRIGRTVGLDVGALAPYRPGSVNGAAAPGGGPR